jgi:hypothetical protein
LGYRRPHFYKASPKPTIQITKQASPTRLHYIHHKFISTYDRVNSFHRLNKQTSFYSRDDQSHIRTSVHMKVVIRK